MGKSNTNQSTTKEQEEITHKLKKNKKKGKQINNVWLFTSLFSQETKIKKKHTKKERRIILSRTSSKSREEKKIYYRIVLIIILNY